MEENSKVWWAWDALECHDCGIPLVAGEDYLIDDYDETDEKPPWYCGRCQAKGAAEDMAYEKMREMQLDVMCEKLMD